MSGKGWNSLKIRGRMIEHSIKVIEVAEKFDTSRQMVNYVINSKFRSAKLADRVRREIAERLGKPYKTIWGVDDKGFWERYK